MADDGSPALGPPPASRPHLSVLPTNIQVITSPERNVLALASMVIGLVGLLPFLYMLPGPIALTLGLIARHQISQSNGTQKGRGLAWTGIILGGLECVLILLVILLIGLIVVTGGTG
jgi:Domain of unknown function (DUF4190)